MAVVIISNLKKIKEKNMITSNQVHEHEKSAQRRAVIAVRARRAWRTAAARRAVFGALAAVCLFAACEQPTSTILSSAPDKPTLSLINRNTQSQTNKGGTITATWAAVDGAAGYKVYYAPCAGSSAPSIPLTPAVTVSVPTAVITVRDIGSGGADYYVWVKAVNAGGESPASPPASALSRFIGHWKSPSGGDSGIFITANDAYYQMMMRWFVDGYIRAVIPFGEDVNFNGKRGAAGVIIVEYDAAKMANSSWYRTPGKYFNAIYYYGLTGYQTGSKAYLGWAALIGDESAGCEADNVDEAIGKFTFASRDSYILSSLVPLHEWRTDPRPSRGIEL
jgi:hypothetical protein